MGRAPERGRAAEPAPDEPPHAARPAMGDGDAAVPGALARAPAAAATMRKPLALPSAFDHVSSIERDLALGVRRAVFFLDYDGTLSPIVDDPDSACIPLDTRDALNTLASRFTTAIVSGRSKEKVRSMVNLEQLIYAGSHGFDIEGPGGAITHIVGKEWLPQLAAASKDLCTLVSRYPGASVEDNLLSVSFHYRKCDQALVPEICKSVDDVVMRHGLLRTRGKMVFEVRPLFHWHKGKAVEYLLDALNLMGPEVLPIYIGDDVTDEDAFKVLRGKGISVIVADASISRDTHADLRLNDPFEVQRFLQRFAGSVTTHIPEAHPVPTVLE